MELEHGIGAWNWSMDFIHDRLSDGRSFRTLNLTDAFTRQCLAQEVDTSLTAKRVVRPARGAPSAWCAQRVVRPARGACFGNRETNSGRAADHSRG